MKFKTVKQFLTHIIDTEQQENNPCKNCDGDCCGEVHFQFDELEAIFQKYGKVPEFKARFKTDSRNSVSKKLIKMLKPHRTEDDTINIKFTKKNIYLQNNINPTSCIFKRNEKIGTDHCMIYEDRPLICKAYGTKTCCCPYAGLDKQPDNGIQKAQLIYDGHKKREDNMFNAMLGRTNE